MEKRRHRDRHRHAQGHQPGNLAHLLLLGAYASYSRTVVTEGSYPANLTNVNGQLYFTANDGTNGTELWTSDGTESGTTMVKDIYPGSTTSTTITIFGYYGDEYKTVTFPNGSYPSNLTNVNGALYFTTSDGNGTELWKSDGTAAGTVSVTGVVGPSNLTNFNGKLFFGEGGISGGLYKSDGTAAGTVEVKPWQRRRPNHEC